MVRIKEYKEAKQEALELARQKEETIARLKEIYYSNQPEECKVKENKEEITDTPSEQ